MLIFFLKIPSKRFFSYIIIKCIGIGSFLIILLLTLYHLSIPPKIYIYYSNHIQIKRYNASYVCEYLFKNSTMNHIYKISDSNQSLWNDRNFSLSNPYSCKQFKLFYGHTVNLSKEEKQFPLAFSIAIHQSNKQLSRLLRLIYRPHNLYCIHVDSKSPQTLYDEVLNSAKCFGPNVIVVNRSESVNVQWGYFSILEVFLLCADKLLNNTDYMWKYILNLTGQELPLRTNWDAQYWFLRILKKIREKLIQFYKTDIKSQKILDAIKAEKHLRKHPDELYFPTLNYNPQFGAPGACINNNHSSSPFIARYVIWGMEKCFSQYTRRSVCIIGKAHLPFIPSRMEFFANKFQEDFQPIAYDCIEYYIMNKVIKEMQTKQLDPNFNVTYYSRLHCSSNHI
ncbi:unnamed protein product [Schistosoma margrebowiei]|uniref:Uncharacterized protein n=1 Tax=Schistosoma margrebowiei TaxID=48269 RepID=A0A183LYN7_9TREM|nr:unnamed protein product [Schistosoma margrebowiei]